MTVVATYTLTNQCGPARPFCRPCTNSFTVITCGPTRCDVEPPSVICLKPIFSSGFDCPECNVAYAYVVTGYDGAWFAELGSTILLRPLPTGVDIINSNGNTVVIGGECIWALDLTHIHPFGFIRLALGTGGILPGLTWVLSERKQLGNSRSTGQELFQGCGVPFNCDWVGSLLGDPEMTVTPVEIEVE